MPKHTIGVSVYLFRWVPHSNEVKPHSLPVIFTGPFIASWGSLLAGFVVVMLLLSFVLGV